MATHSSFLAWEITGTEESIGLQPLGSQRVGHNIIAYACDDVCLRALSVSAADAWTREAPQRR